jgi:DNA repair protein RecN (Recombination protein N)
MLSSLRVRDLTTIADVTLELGEGLNVLTGETGAGKSMVVDALALLLGDRADRAAVRPGAVKAIVEGVISGLPRAALLQLEASGLDAEETLVIRREVTAEGRSRAWINGSPTTAGVLASLGATLVDLHGQHQTLQLLEAAEQRALVDAFAEAGPAAEAVALAWRDTGLLHTEREALLARRDEAIRRADWLRHVVEEVDAAGLTAGEDETLDRDIARLAQAGALGEEARRLADALDGDDGSTRTAIGQAERALNALERHDPTVGEWRALLDGAYAQLDELARSAAAYADAIAEEPARLGELERRRDLLFTLKRKHGATIADVLATRNAAREELDLLDRAAFDLRTLEARAGGAESALRALAADLTAKRTAAGERLAREVTRLLPELGLVGGRFRVTLAPVPEVREHGAEEVVFEVQLNAGMEPRPLARVASGGELSRLMLALKVVLARADAVPTLVFDEIDQGIGGEVGGRVGAALAQVAVRHQVLVITHLPQIAARGDRHLRIAKATRDGMATSDVTRLYGEDRVLELARMLGGSGEAERGLALALLGEGVSAR